MRTVGFCILLAVMGGAGCVSEKKAQLEARQAYVAGQAQATQAALQAQQQQGPVVLVQGPVNRPVVPWEEGMKLSKAIVTAQYTGIMDPRLVQVLRDGQVVGEFKAIDLLNRHDMDLEAGDSVVIVQ
ncbi:MAG TPA: hypothetical protein VGR14_00910 [Verrucomicrobiae bacterium]|jgi:hypothetical protein|nr:hypothetical protein [Verrucomicrobiae bacterium]